VLTVNTDIGTCQHRVGKVQSVVNIICLCLDWLQFEESIRFLGSRCDNDVDKDVLLGFGAVKTPQTQRLQLQP
jgi:hypothetical protein